MAFMEKFSSRRRNETDDQGEYGQGRAKFLYDGALQTLPTDIAERLRTLECPQLWYPSPLNDTSQLAEDVAYTRHIEAANLSMLPLETQELARYAAARRHNARKLMTQKNYYECRALTSSTDPWSSDLAHRVFIGAEPKLHPYEAIDFMAQAGMESIECGRRTHLGDFAEGSIDQMNTTLRSTVEYFGGIVDAESDVEYRVELLDIDPDFEHELPFSQADAVIVTRRKNIGAIPIKDGGGRTTDKMEVRLRTSYLLPLKDCHEIDMIARSQGLGAVNTDIANQIETLLSRKDIHTVIPLSSTAYAFSRKVAAQHAKMHEDTSEHSTQHGEYIPYDELSADLHSNPTPLDPVNTMISERSYKDWKLMMIQILADESAHRHDVSRRSRLAMTAELEREADVLISRNQQAMARLDEIIKDKEDLAHDLVFQEDIEKAKIGDADLEALIYILKRCPDVISLEAMNFIKPCDRNEIKRAQELLHNSIEALTQHDSESYVEIIPEAEQKTTEKIDSITGARIQKRVIATARSVDSAIEIVQKDVWMDLSFYGGNRALSPISTAVYLRVADYVERKAYEVSAEEGIDKIIRRIETDQDVFYLDEDNERIVEALTDIGRIALLDPEIQKIYDQIPSFEDRHAYVKNILSQNNLDKK